MTLAFTKPTVVPTHSTLIGTSFWITSVTRTGGGGVAGGAPCLQPKPTSTHAAAIIAARRARARVGALLDIREVFDVDVMLRVPSATPVPTAGHVRKDRRF